MNASQEWADGTGLGRFLARDAGGFRRYLTDYQPVLSGKGVLQVAESGRASGRAELLAKRHAYWASTVVFSN